MGPMTADMSPRAEAMTRSAALLAAIALCTASIGCGGGSPRPVVVRGQVTYQGRPLGTGTVAFIPAEPGPPATGQIQPDGQYTLSTFRPGDGALPGRYAVMVIAVGDTTGHLPDEANPPASLLIPRKYASHRTSDLTADVSEANNVIPLELK
jgi:hypothetical protein